MVSSSPKQLDGLRLDDQQKTERNMTRRGGITTVATAAATAALMLTPSVAFIVPATWHAPGNHHQHASQTALQKKRDGVRLYGRVKKGSMKKELAGISKPKDPSITEMKAKKKKKGNKKKSAKAEGSGGEDDNEEDDEEEDGEEEAAMGGIDDGPITLDTELPPEVAQGRRVLDPVTKRPLFLPEDEDARSALCFPRPDADQRARARLQWTSATGHEEILTALKAAAKGGNETMRECVLANHDFLGVKGALLLTGVKMNAQYRKAVAEQKELETTRSLYLLAEASLNAPFRQLCKEAELRIGPVVGDYKALGKLAKKLGPSDMSATWILLKAAVATWEDKYLFDQMTEQRLAAAAETAEGMATSNMEGKLLAARQTVRQTIENVKLWQTMCANFLAVPSVTSKIRPELIFLEQALPLESEAEVRALAIKSFCAPDSEFFAALTQNVDGDASEDRALAELRERVRLIKTMTPRLNPANYGGLATKIKEVSDALGRGTNDDVEYYRRARAAGACYYETYEMPQTEIASLRQWEKSSMVDEKRRMDSLPKPERPKDLDWYHEPLVEAAKPQFVRVAYDDPDFEDDNDPEKWDSTVEIRTWEAEKRAELRKLKSSSAGMRKKMSMPPLAEDVPFPGTSGDDDAVGKDGDVAYNAFVADFESMMESDELRLLERFGECSPDAIDDKELEDFLESLS